MQQKIIPNILKMLFFKRYNDLNELYSNKLFTSKINNIHNISIEYLIAIEDKRYSSHFGIDLISICRAIKKLILYRKIEGASTIEQQLVRVLTERYQKTLARKLSEMILAIIISNEKDKLEIAKLYLSIAYYGWNTNGYEEAYKKHVEDVKNPSNFELACIIASLRYPEPKIITNDYLIKLRNRAKYAIKLTSH